jgi:hypothetical protein
MQITVRGLHPELAEALARLAKAEGLSLNKAALKLLARGAGLTSESRSKTVIGTDLDSLFGTWTASEAQVFLESTRSLDEIEEGLWK